MVAIVVVINLLIALFGFWLACKVWRLRRTLSQAADAIALAERNTHHVLGNAPTAILRGQLGTQELRQTYQQLQPKVRQAQQALALLSLSQTILSRRFLLRRIKKSTATRR
ncbi:hypothetical protein [Myxacorys almedinensis]|uniref:Uncharacterized protein n=1 Tax=Myxacorys almedinensis A TaxID=2690445 RepID=A0A8J8CNB8_9CYAN|nr:hypothetical protein [Myxacorys almedinensis]NDJ18257.1 hypothetical protein [Myxacorys almedinensis A]